MQRACFAQIGNDKSSLDGALRNTGRKTSSRASHERVELVDRRRKLNAEQ